MRKKLFRRGKFDRKELKNNIIQSYDNKIVYDPVFTVQLKLLPVFFYARGYVMGVVRPSCAVEKRNVTFNIS